MTTDDEDAYLRALGLRLRLLRIASQLSQAQLGDAANVTRAQVSAIERADPAANLLVYARLAGAFGLRLPDLVDFDLADGQVLQLLGYSSV
jgi:transcriptional regulator with XRE-family HTH domain